MTDRSREPHEPAEFDSEIHVRAIFGVLAGLVLLVALSFGGVFAFGGFLRSRSVARDPEPLPLAEANAPRPRPRAALQADPTADMKAFARKEEAALTSYAWVDRANGVAQVPVSRALELVAERGLPVPPPLPEAAAAPAAPGAAK
jgi:hypothetical protein